MNLKVWIYSTLRVKAISTIREPDANSRKMRSKMTYTFFILSSISVTYQIQCNLSINQAWVVKAFEKWERQTRHPQVPPRYLK